MNPTFLPSLFDPKFRCCCGYCHVTTATKIICYFLLSLLIFTTILTAFIKPNNLTVFRIIADIIFGSVFIASLYGLHKEQPQWFIPFFVVTGFGIIFATIFLIIPVIYLIFNPEESHQFIPKKYKWSEKIEYTMEEFMEPVSTKIILSRAFIQFIVVIFHIWFLFIFYRCYQFLHAKKVAESQPKNNSTPFYTNPATNSFVSLQPYSNTA